MNQTWDLSVLYKDFDDPAYAADMAALDAAIAALHKLAEEAGTLSASELTHRYADAGDAFVALESKLYSTPRSATPLTRGIPLPPAR